MHCTTLTQSRQARRAIEQGGLAGIEVYDDRARQHISARIFETHLTGARTVCIGDQVQAGGIRVGEASHAKNGIERLLPRPPGIPTPGC